MATTSLRTYVARSGTSATNSTAVSLSAATAKSVVGVIGAATDTIALHRLQVSFPSVTGTDVPALVECGITTAAGTNTALVPVQTSGLPLASSATGGYNYTVEPTYSRIFFSAYVPIYNGFLSEWWPLGLEPQCAISQGFAIRITSPSATTVYASLTYSE